MCLFELPDFADHEAVHLFHDKASGLKAIIALHNTNLGPAIGGCRMWNYASTTDALTDVLRLSQGMTYKAAMAGLRYGGGKSVIIGDANTAKSQALFEAFGRAVDSLGGRYYTGEDVGTSPSDMAYAGTVTDFVLGREERGSSGDPSPFTAAGVAMGMEVAAESRFGSANLAGRKIAIQGLGAVGMPLAEELHARGAKIVAADLDPSRLARAKQEFDAEIVDIDAILATSCDILAPCALGAAIDEASLPELRCAIVAGSANNQLATPAMGDALFECGIAYAPDYIINAGGLINIAQELEAGGYKRTMALAALDVIPKQLERIFKRAKSEALPEHLIADQMAKDIVAGAKAKDRLAKAA